MTLVYTPGVLGPPQPWPQLTMPTTCHRSEWYIRGPPLSPCNRAEQGLLGRAGRVGWRGRVEWRVRFLLLPLPALAHLFSCTPPALSAGIPHSLCSYCSCSLECPSLLEQKGSVGGQISCGCAHSPLSQRSTTHTSRLKALRGPTVMKPGYLCLISYSPSFSPMECLLHAGHCSRQLGFNL